MRQIETTTLLRRKHLHYLQQAQECFLFFVTSSPDIICEPAAAAASSETYALHEHITPQYEERPTFEKPWFCCRLAA